MKKYMQFRTEPRKLPIVLSIEEVSAILAAAPGPGMKYRAALSIGYGAGLRASEPPPVCRRLQSKYGWSLWKKVTEQTGFQPRCAPARFG